MLRIQSPYKSTLYGYSLYSPKADYTMAYEAQSNHTTQVTVILAGRPYLLNINKSDEAMIIRLAKEINNKISAFQAKQPDRDLQDCLAFTMLTYAVDAQRTAQKNQATASSC